MKSFAYIVLAVLIIVLILVIGASIFPEPSWGGILFYSLFFLGLIGAAGYWILNIK
ncbi:MAG: hypothetical protein GTO02_03880 [Candidatus Dadabacteria bacterium]|nr:hypothetical protein [Candidatus Dadabacteria bacterium]NIQ13565.1 hypothetical protein [Candidatus Dadabacteria bacterium]